MVRILSQKIRLNQPLGNKLSVEFIGKIRDSLHSTIPFTQAEKIVIDRPEFQRLRRIDQTGFIKYIFPGATHSRFEHSLGVMHVAGLLHASLIANQRYLLTSLDKFYAEASAEAKETFLALEEKCGSLLQTRKALEQLENSPYLIQCLRFAALLHDCGHGPFSHSSEKFMMSWHDFEIKLPSLSIPEWLKKALKNKIEEMHSTGYSFTENKISHEIFTVFVIARIFQYKDILLSEQMGQDVSALIDLSIPPHPDGDLQKSGLQSLLHEMISGEIDADRMDYLLRDSMKCGVVYGYFDLERILDSVGFYFDSRTNNYHMAMRKSGVSAFEDYLKARLSMYQQVYFHKTATACEAMLEHASKKLKTYCLPIELDEYLKIDDASFLYHLKEKFIDEDNRNIMELMSDLIRDRRLWKKVYEESSPLSLDNEANVNSILEELQRMGISFEMIKTSKNLTCFFPLETEEESKNNFKIILKDINSLRYLDPVEKHSFLINQINEEFSIKRIFISKHTKSGDSVDMHLIQKMISEKLG